MTKRDFELIAATFRSTRPISYRMKDATSQAMTAVWDGVVTSMSVALTNQYPRFSPEKFRSACGME